MDAYPFDPPHEPDYDQEFFIPVEAICRAVDDIYGNLSTERGYTVEKLGECECGCGWLDRETVISMVYEPIEKLLRLIGSVTPPDRPHRCWWCGNPLSSRLRPDARYCSGTCRVAAHRAAHKAQA